MNILFITSSRIGDAVLSTGLLNYISQERPNARVTIACGPLAASLFEGYPNLEQIIALKKQKLNKHWIELWKKTVGTHWDMVVDLRNSAVSRLIRSKQRYIFGSHIDKSQHKVEQNAAVMKLDCSPSPKLWFTDKQNSKAQELIPDGAPVLGVGPAANWAGKTWPAERFIEVVEFITSQNGVIPGARVAIFAAPGEKNVALKVLESVSENQRINIIAKTNSGGAAAALARCNFYIGNDSGLMHCAAATGIPTFGLFGPSYPNIYRPWGDHVSYASTPESYDDLINYKSYTPATAPCLMMSLEVEDVIKQIKELFNGDYGAEALHK